MKRCALLATILFIATVAAVTSCAGDERPAVSTQTPTPSTTQPTISPPAIISQSPIPSPQSPIPELWRDPVPAAALETKQTLETVDAPQRDLVDLVARFGDPDQPAPRVARDEPWGFVLGDGHAFWVQDKGTGDYRQVRATLVYETPHAYWFVAEGLELTGRDLHKTAERFEGETYPANRRIFGQEWSPGVDSDPHLTVLLSGDLGGGVSAYQNSLDEYPQALFPFSNQMEMITASAAAANLDDPAFDCTLAHEFQHVIQWAVDRDEQTWLNEVFGLLACPLNDLEAEYAGFVVEAFAHEPDTQLNVWGSEPDRVAAQYGAGQLFGAYFLERFGEEGVQTLVADPKNGLRSVDSALKTLDSGLDGDDLFADWVAANYLDDADLPGGRYGYRDLTLPAFMPAVVVGADSLPVEEQATVGQYAADYVAFNGPGEFQVRFSGATLVRPVAVAPYSGRTVWWGGRAQESDTTLSRGFDLSGLDEATLTFYTYFDIEEGFDYAYVAVSTDGRRWQALPGQTTVSGDATHISLGPGYTGRSEGWIQERIDLTPFAGQEIQLRFEYVTDDGPLRPGFLLDDIAIPELGYRDDAESDGGGSLAGGWSAAGFLRQANILPQEWMLQLITQRSDATQVERLQLSPDNSGRWQIDLGSGETAVLAVSGLTRGTAETADYWLRVSGRPTP